MGFHRNPIPNHHTNHYYNVILDITFISITHTGKKYRHWQNGNKIKLLVIITTQVIQNQSYILINE